MFCHKIESPHLTLFFLGGRGLLCATCMFESHKQCLCIDTSLKDGVLLYGPLIYCHIYDGVYMAVSTLRQMLHVAKFSGGCRIFTKGGPDSNTKFFWGFFRIFCKLTKKKFLKGRTPWLQPWLLPWSSSELFHIHFCN